MPFDGSSYHDDEVLGVLRRCQEQVDQLGWGRFNLIGHWLNEKPSPCAMGHLQIACGLIHWNGCEWHGNVDDETEPLQECVRYLKRAIGERTACALWVAEWNDDHCEGPEDMKALIGHAMELREKDLVKERVSG